MKLSFSIRGWQGYTWEDFCRAARDMKLQGIELHDIHGVFRQAVYECRGSPAGRRGESEANAEYRCQ